MKRQEIDKWINEVVTKNPDWILSTIIQKALDHFQKDSKSEEEETQEQKGMSAEEFFYMKHPSCKDVDSMLMFRDKAVIELMQEYSNLSQPNEVTDEVIEERIIDK